VTFYCNCMKMSKSFALNFGDSNWLLHHDNAPFFTREVLAKKQHDSCLTRLSHLTCPSAAFLCFLLLCYFDPVRWSRQNCRWYWTTSWNTTSRMHLKMTEALGKVHTCGMDYFEGDGGQ
jgi:hypothetical protein